MPVKVHKASDYLKTPEDIAAYLNAAIEEFDGDPRLLMKAFRNVAAAQGGVSELARRAEVNRVGLSRSLSGNRDPRLGTVAKIASACGVSLQFVAS
ncbi:MAG: putative addiction module antidote protein [Nitrospira sp. SB0677_bin_15]|nr:putative addiction module antidote protein [Nitrospira sp. SB0661_bin_20]MYG39937.1 putative addiction module antidote protein [Nitrospira sp. SB0677_bin_15]MYJ23056.1 putative addiction module antidote protein [Nitrospira sp. SB0673_bin_12]